MCVCLIVLRAIFSNVSYVLGQLARLLLIFKHTKLYVLNKILYNYKS